MRDSITITVRQLRWRRARSVAFKARTRRPRLNSPSQGEKLKGGRHINNILREKIPKISRSPAAEAPRLTAPAGYKAARARLFSHSEDAASPGSCRAQSLMYALARGPGLFALGKIAERVTGRDSTYRAKMRFPGGSARETPPI